MDKKLLADFLFKFLNGSTENIKLFYTSFLTDRICRTFDFYEAIPFGARLLAILLEDEKTEEKQLLIEHLTALYNNYASLYLQSTRTIDNGEQDNNPNDFNNAFGDGDLNCNEFNNIIEVLVKNYRVSSFYYELQLNKVIVNFPRQSINERYKTMCFELKENGGHVYLVQNKIKCKLEGKKSINNLLKAKGSATAISISNAIKRIINKTQLNEPCCWCNPTEPTKHKCNNCRQLDENYSKLLKECNFLPKDLNQVIKRVQKKATYKTIEELRKLIKNKIHEMIVTSCNKNTSSIPSTFINNLLKWYKNI